MTYTSYNDFLGAVKRGFFLQFVPEQFKTEELCMAAVRKNPFNLEFVPEGCKTLEICLEAFSQDSYVLAFIPAALKTTVSFATHRSEKDV